MGKVTKYVPNRRAGRQLLHSPKIVADVKRRTQAVEDKSNADSSWGGYNSEVDLRGSRPRGRVWSISKARRAGADRGMRMVRNLDAGR